MSSVMQEFVRNLTRKVAQTVDETVYAVCGTRDHGVLLGMANNGELSIEHLRFADVDEPLVGRYDVILFGKIVASVHIEYVCDGIQRSYNIRTEYV